MYASIQCERNMYYTYEYVYTTANTNDKMVV